MLRKRGNLYAIGLGKEFLDLAPKRRPIRGKIDTWDLIS